MGFFDPLQFTKDTEKVAYLRDAELKHCRVAMFAVLGWMTTASGYHPLIDALKIAPGATPLSDMNALPSVAWAQIGVRAPPRAASRVFERGSRRARASD
jgi:hypothetical protein